MELISESNGLIHPSFHSNHSTNNYARAHYSQLSDVSNVHDVVSALDKS